MSPTRFLSALPQWLVQSVVFCGLIASGLEAAANEHRPWPKLEEVWWSNEIRLPFWVVLCLADPTYMGYIARWTTTGFIAISAAWGG
jgi:hypothetical protein